MVVSVHQHLEVIQKLDSMVEGLYQRDWDCIRGLICQQIQITYVINDHESTVSRDAERQIQVWREMLAKVKWKVERQGRVNINALAERLHIAYPVSSQFLDESSGACLWKEQGHHEIFMHNESGELRFKSIRIKIKTAEGEVCVLRDQNRALALAQSAGSALQ